MPLLAVARRTAIGRVDCRGYPAAAMVVSFKNDRVFSIATGNPRYHTATGMGSAVAEVRKFPNVSCTDLGSGAFDRKVDDSGGLGNAPLIDFQVEGGKVRRVEVQSVNE